MSSFRRAFLSAVGALPVLVVFWAPGCAKQAEGERCDSNSGDNDCEGALKCWSADDLIDHSTSRCCPQEGETITDDRCLPSTGAGTGGTDGGKTDSGADGSDSSSGGSGGAAGTGGSAGSGGAAGSGGTGGSDGGIACTYSSQCPGTQVCGPTGYCQVECLGDKDCSGGETCNTSTNTCEAPSDAGQD